MHAEYFGIVQAVTQVVQNFWDNFAHEIVGVEEALIVDAVCNQVGIRLRQPESVAQLV